jgi:ribonuclease T1
VRRTLSLDRVALIAVLLVALVGLVVFARSGSAKPTAGPAPSTSATAGTSSSTVAASALPPEARTTIKAIQAGGPFPYDRDGIVFENREGLLPAEPSGFYHEYTVPTPGSGDRGARRIVQSSGDVLYWSSDHYKTFKQIVLNR